MAKTFTRQALHELVWSQPRTALAKQLGVSDVWIGKQCAQTQIPVPPQGHWARKQAGKNSPKVALPVRPPGMATLITMGDPSRDQDWRVSQDLDEPIVEPSFSENMDEQVEAVLKMIGRVTICRDLSAPHVSLKKVFAAEARRREKFTESPWSYYKPRFDTPTQQRQLRIFSSLSQAMGCVYGRSDVYEHDEWIQGLGTTHHLRLRLNMGDVHLGLEFAEPLGPDAPKRAKGPTTTTLRVGGSHDKLGIEEWLDSPENKLERQMDVIVKALLYRAERTLRNHAQHSYEWRLTQRKDQLERIEARKRAAEKQQMESILARRELIRSMIVRLAEESRSANDIRTMVSAMAQHPGLNPSNMEMFEAWKREALAVAEHLDPMTRSFEELISSFKINTSIVGL